MKPRFSVADQLLLHDMLRASRRVARISGWSRSSLFGGAAEGGASFIPLVLYQQGTTLGEIGASRMLRECSGPMVDAVRFGRAWPLSTAA